MSRAASRPFPLPLRAARPRLCLPEALPSACRIKVLPPSLSLIGPLPPLWPHTWPSLFPPSVPALQGPPHRPPACPLSQQSVPSAQPPRQPTGGARAPHLPWAAARSFRQVRSPLTAAWCRGRAPSRVSRAAAWPSRSSHCTSRGCPKRAARCSGETPELSWSYGAQKGRERVAGLDPPRLGSVRAQEPAAQPTLPAWPESVCSSLSAAEPGGLLGAGWGVAGGNASPDLPGPNP